MIGLLDLKGEEEETSKQKKASADKVVSLHITLSSNLLNCFEISLDSTSDDL